MASQPPIRRRRILRFVLIFPAILLALNGFACATAFLFTGLPGGLAVGIISSALVTAFVATSLLGFRRTSVGLRVVYAVSAAWIGFLNLAFLAAIACWLADGIARVAGGRSLPPSVAASLFGAALLAAGYGLLNARRLRVTRITVKLARLPEAWEGRTLALVGDLHLGHVLGPRFVRKVLGSLRACQPDAVLISGDMFDGTPLGLDRLVADWHGFRPPRGVFYVTGNHDEFAGREIYAAAVARTGIRVLNNEMVTVAGLQIVGVHDSELAEPAVLREILRGVRLDPALPSVLLAHRPVNLAVAEEAGISLQVSGHTHRGQMWPWSLLVSRIYGPFAYGLHRLGRLQVCTTSGAGTWGPPLRLGTKSEWVLIRLEQADRAAVAPPT